jgi:hypothetical protein
MTPQELKDLLAVYRPGTADDQDPLFDQARAHLAADPELRAWFERQQAFDTAVRERLRAVPVPKGLLGRLLSTPGPVPARPVAFPRRQWLALAASLAVALGGVALWRQRSSRPASPFDAYCGQLVEWLAVFPKLEFESERLSEVTAWLAANGGPARLDVPAALQQFPTLGCRRVEHAGRTASLVCFMVDGEVVHVFSLAGPSLEGGPIGDAPRFAGHGAYTRADWSRDRVTYVILTRADPSKLRRLLAA